MSLGDKISNKAEDLGGKAKEATGNVTGDEKLQAEGKGDQAKAGLKDAVEDVKDAVGDVADKIKGVFKKD
ncbi:CsbD family protein [Amycolatopsis sp. H20-H5]|uniref:CsbD family protein n=1 Tax=Amycolatopsis sp. H20-H5 TaxID=3046309 RepID=UPI002DB7E2AE|nr:CsbD family protein [Amycolatopsis sp. H20-H5]MEC3981308.1 CsbD family protein [Amycolatopsis sp. H20-H5]